MFLQIFPPDNAIISESVFESQLVFVLLGLTISVFFILRVNKLLSKVRVIKKPIISAKPRYTFKKV